MFRLHETTRRRVCRLAFVALCALPTIGTIGWIGHWHRPWRVRDAEARLASLLRSDVQLADWQEPRPAATQTSSLRVFARGAAKPLLDATDARSSRVGDSLVISIGRLAIDAPRLSAALQRAWHVLVGAHAGDVRLTVHELAVTDVTTGTIYDLHRVELHAVRTGGDMWKLQVIGRSGESEDAPVLRAACEQRLSDPESRVKAAIDATTAPLPAWLLAEMGPIFGSVGQESSFAGILELDVGDEGIVGEARGAIQNAALEAMRPTNSPLRAEGQSNLTFDSLRWRHGQIEQLTGTMRAQKVRVNRALLDGATKLLWFRQDDVGQTLASDASEMVSIDAIALRFDFNRKGLSVGSDFPAEANLPAGCVAVKEGRPLLMQPQYLLPAGLWVQFVAGPSTATMPATQEGVDAARRLPLPEAETTTH